MHITAMRSKHGQLQVTCCDCHVIMCSCDFSFASAECQSANWRFPKVRFWGPENILAFYVGSKVRAATSQVMKACRWSRGIAPPTLHLNFRWKCVFSLTLMSFYTRWYRTGGWLDRQTGRTFSRRENSLVPAEFRVPELSNPKYRVCPKSHEIYFLPLSYWSQPVLTGWVRWGGTLIFITHQRSVCCENQKNPYSWFSAPLFRDHVTTRDGG